MSRHSRSASTSSIVSFFKGKSPRREKADDADAKNDSDTESPRHKESHKKSLLRLSRTPMPDNTTPVQANGGAGGDNNYDRDNDDEDSTPRTEPLPELLKKSKKASKSDVEWEEKTRDIKQMQRSTLRALVDQETQQKAMKTQLDTLSKNMETFYIVATKQLERIYNNVDEIGRTGRLRHGPSSSSSSSHRGDRETLLGNSEHQGTDAEFTKKECCCILL